MEIKVYAPFNRILVKEIEQDNVTQGGILLSSTTTDVDNKSRYGEVVKEATVQVADEFQKIPRGTKLYFGKFAGAAVNTPQGEFISIGFNDITALEVYYDYS